MAFEPLTGAVYPNLINVAKGLDPDGSVADVAELYAQSNPIIMDIPMIQGNLPTGHRSTIRSDIPEPVFRRAYKGVKPTSSKKIQVEDTIGIVEEYAAVDKEVADLNGNTAAFRLDEDKPHIEGMSNKMARSVFYCDTDVTPEGFLGLGPRYAVTDIATVKPGAVVQSSQLSNVISLEGTTDLASMWLVIWSPSTVFGVFPKGSRAGLFQEDQGEQRLSDNEGGWFQGYVSHYQWKMGLVVKDWRCVVRICNIDVSAIADTATQTALYIAMIKALHTLPPGAVGNKMFYCPPAIAAMLDLAATDKSNAALGAKEVFGEELTTFRRVPIRQCNALLETETQVIASA